MPLQLLPLERILLAADGLSYRRSSAVGHVAFPPFLYCFLVAAATDADVAVSFADKSAVFAARLCRRRHKEATSVTDATVATVAAWSDRGHFLLPLRCRGRRMKALPLPHRR
jgi:hypothetical protein